MPVVNATGILSYGVIIMKRILLCGVLSLFLLVGCTKEEVVIEDEDLSKGTSDNPIGEYVAVFDDSDYTGFVFGQNEYTSMMTIIGYEGDVPDLLEFPERFIGAETNSIGYEAFANDRRLKDVRFPYATSFGFDCFRGSSITSITIDDVFMPEEPGSYSAYCFAECDQLKSFYCKAYMLGPEPYMFYNDFLLETVEFQYSFDSIYEETFSGCSSLKDVWLPGTIEFIDETAFKDVPKSCTIHGYNGTWLEQWVKDNGFKWSGEDVLN